MPIFNKLTYSARLQEDKLKIHPKAMATFQKDCFRHYSQTSLSQNDVKHIISLLSFTRLELFILNSKKLKCSYVRGQFQFGLGQEIMCMKVFPVGTIPCPCITVCPTTLQKQCFKAVICSDQIKRFLLQFITWFLIDNYESVISWILTFQNLIHCCPPPLFWMQRTFLFLCGLNKQSSAVR